MKNIIFFIFLTICFYKIKSQNVEYGSLSVDEFVSTINDNTYTTKDYSEIIKSLINSLQKYYIFLNITKNPPINIEAVDLVGELKSIDVSKIKSFYHFFISIQNILSKAKDLHLSFIFNSLLNYAYVSPVEYNIKTVNDQNYLYFNLSTIIKKRIHNLFDLTLITQIIKKEGLKIVKINGQDPFDFIYNFNNKLLKDDHAVFSMNLQMITAGNVMLGFNKEKFKNFIITLEDNTSIKFNYKIIYPKNVKKEFQLFYEKEIKKYYELSLYIPTIFEIEEKYNSLQNKENRFLQNIKWDLIFEDSLKLKVDKKNEVNVIYQNTFMFASSLSECKTFFDKMIAKLSSNKYPIIVIESFNSGGYVELALLLQKVLNYNLVSSRFKITVGANDELNKFIDKNFDAFDIETCERDKLSNSKIFEDNFGNNVTHYRTKFYLGYNTKKLFNQIESDTYERKPTDIIIFTDGFSYSATSIFIKDLYESGNAIIVGYNGIPNQKRKKEKFNASQSPSMVLGNFSQFFLLDDKDIATLHHYNIFFGTPFSPSYNDKYQNDSTLQIPREFTIELIDERSNIYGRYEDSRYEEFVKEGLRIFKKYTNSCNPNNTNLLYKSDCKFEDKHTHGGYLCGSNGNWTNICKPSYCDKGYYFDTYLKKCKEDKCYSISVLFIVLIILLVVILVLFLVYRCWKCNKSDSFNTDMTGRLFPSTNT